MSTNYDSPIAQHYTSPRRDPSYPTTTAVTMPARANKYQPTCKTRRPRHAYSLHHKRMENEVFKRHYPPACTYTTVPANTNTNTNTLPSNTMPFIPAPIAPTSPPSSSEPTQSQPLPVQPSPSGETSPSSITPSPTSSAEVSSNAISPTISPSTLLSPSTLSLSTPITTATNSIATTSASPGALPPNGRGDGDGSKISGTGSSNLATVLGAAIGAFAFFALVALLIYRHIDKRRRRRLEYIGPDYGNDLYPEVSEPIARTGDPKEIPHTAFRHESFMALVKDAAKGFYTPAIMDITAGSAAGAGSTAAHGQVLEQGRNFSNDYHDNNDYGGVGRRSREVGGESATFQDSAGVKGRHSYDSLQYLDTGSDGPSKPVHVAIPPRNESYYI